VEGGEEAAGEGVAGAEAGVGVGMAVERGRGAFEADLPGVVGVAARGVDTTAA
jgi:hypothetical protein